MINKHHPDVMLYHSYNDGKDTIHLRVVPITTHDFPHGLELSQTFTDKETAIAEAIKVQIFLAFYLEHAYKLAKSEGKVP